MRGTGLGKSPTFADSAKMGHPPQKRENINAAPGNNFEAKGCAAHQADLIFSRRLTRIRSQRNNMDNPKKTPLNEVHNVKLVELDSALMGK